MCTFALETAIRSSMKLILMSTPYFFVEEHQILTALFDEGLELLHLRKPATEPVYSERLLSLLSDSCRKKIVVHDHFYLKNEYNLRGIHLNSRNPEPPRGYKGKSAAHAIPQRRSWPKRRSMTTFCSLPSSTASPKPITPPPFRKAELRDLGRRKVIDRKVMAMGGISIDNIGQLRDYGFGGAVVLGAIWNRFNMHTAADFKELISHFRKLRKAIG